MIWQARKEWFGKTACRITSDLSDLATKTLRRITILGSDLAKHLAESLLQGVIWHFAWSDLAKCYRITVIWQSQREWFGVIWQQFRLPNQSDLALQGEWFGIFRRVIWSESLVIWMIWHLVGLGDSSWVIPCVLSYLALCRITNHSVIWWFGKRFRFLCRITNHSVISDLASQNDLITHHSVIWWFGNQFCRITNHWVISDLASAEHPIIQSFSDVIRLQGVIWVSGSIIIPQSVIRHPGVILSCSAYSGVSRGRGCCWGCGVYVSGFTIFLLFYLRVAFPLQFQEKTGRDQGIWTSPGFHYPRGDGKCWIYAFSDHGYCSGNCIFWIPEYLDLLWPALVGIANH